MAKLPPMSPMSPVSPMDSGAPMPFAKPARKKSGGKNSGFGKKPMAFGKTAKKGSPRGR